MKAYLASNYSRRLELLIYGQALSAHGIEVTSTWTDGHHEVRPNIDTTGTGDEQATWAREDLDDLRRSDSLILFTGAPGPRMRGGCHTEFGVALGLGHRLFVVGPRANVFHHLPEVSHFDTWLDCLEYLLECQRAGVSP